MDRTQAIIARLASDHEGEVLAAVAALRRLAAAKKLRIEEFITTKVDQQSSIVMRRETNYSRQAKPDYYGKSASSAYADDIDDRKWLVIRRLVYEVLETGMKECELTNWEISFMASIRNVSRLTVKQMTALKNIAIKLGVPT